MIEGRALLADIDSGDTDRWAGSFEATDAADADAKPISSSRGTGTTRRR